MKALIFDFDQTLADTQCLESLRKSRNWKGVYSRIAEISIYPGVVELIEKAKSNGYKIGVVTNSPKRYCDLAVTTFLLRVDVIVGYHDTVNKKPHADPVLLALRNLKCEPQSSFGLGDSTNDILAYNNAGVRSVGCLWGCNDKTIFANPETNIIITVPSQLYPYL